jgi:dipeptidyl aminopeptidase/acylaminoacyl peptidase
VPQKRDKTGVAGMFCFMFTRIGTAFLATMLLTGFVQAQGTRADYERAANLDGLFAGKVINAQVDPHWAADGNSFWFREDDGQGGKRVIVVDAIAGTRQPATNPATEPSDGSLPQLARVRPSRSSAEQTSIMFVNKTQAAVKLFWIDEGGDRKSYGEIAAGEQREQHTYSGHVWLASDPSGKTLGIFSAVEGGGEAIIDGKPQPTTDRAVRRNRRPQSNGQSPDGKLTAYVDQSNIYLRDNATNAVSQLTTDGTDSDWYEDRLFWSPDSRSLVTLKTLDGDHRKVYYVQSSPPDQLQPKLQSYDYPKPGDKIPLTKPHLFDIASRKEIPIKDDLFPNPWELSRMQWAEDSKRFTFVYNQRGHQVLRVIAADASSGKCTAIIDEQSKTFIDYSGKFYYANLPDAHEIIWMSERDGWNHLYLIDEQTGEVKNQITKGHWVVRGVDRIDKDKRQIWFRAGGIDPKQDPYYVHVCCVNFDGTELIDLTPGDGTHRVVYSPDNRFYLDTYSRVDLPPVTELRRTSDAKLICEVQRADDSRLRSAGWQQPEHFVAKGRDGVTDIYGVIYRPMHFDPAKKYPIIEDIYAGPQDSFVPKSFIRSNRDMAYAELGFIVVQIDGMGTSNRSKAFHDVCWHNLGDSGFPDRILWIKAAAEKYPYMDIDRVGIFGTSAGGQSALRAVEAFGDFYKAAVADCGCHDNRMDKIWWNEQWMGWPIGPWYEEQSNVTNAKDLHGALLLIVGEADHNVDPASTMQVVNALIKADKDFDLLVIPNAGHGQDGAYGDRRRKDFFVRNLLHFEPRAN